MTQQSIEQHHLKYWMKEAETQRIRADKAEEEMTSLQEMVDGANYQAQQAIQQLYDEKKVMEKENTERIRERNKVVNEQYQRADKAEQEVGLIREESTIWECRAIAAEQSISMFDNLFQETHADLVVAQKERDKIKKLVNTIDEALDDALNKGFKIGEWDEIELRYDFMNIVKKQITAYREGSNTDAKRD